MQKITIFLSKIPKHQFDFHGLLNHIGICLISYLPEWNSYYRYITSVTLICNLAVDFFLKFSIVLIIHTYSSGTMNTTAHKNTVNTNLGVVYQSNPGRLLG